MQVFVCLQSWENNFVPSQIVLWSIVRRQWITICLWGGLNFPVYLLYMPFSWRFYPKRLTVRHTPWSNVGLRALLKGPTAVQILSWPHQGSNHRPCGSKSSSINTTCYRLPVFSVQFISSCFSLSVSVSWLRWNHCVGLLYSTTEHSY